MTKIVLSILMKLVTTKVVEELVLIALKHLAQFTENKIDDDIYNVVKDALQK